MPDFGGTQSILDLMEDIHFSIWWDTVNLNLVGHSPFSTLWNMVIYTSCNKDGGSNLDYLTFPTTVHCMGHAQNIVLSLLNITERSSAHLAQAQHSAYLDPVSDMLRKSTEINSTENEGRSQK